MLETQPVSSEAQRCSLAKAVASLIAPVGVAYFFYIPGNDILPDFKDALWSRSLHVVLLVAVFSACFAWGTWAYGLLPFRLRPAQASITRCRLTSFYIAISTWAAFASWLVVAGVAFVTMKEPRFAVIGHTLWISGLITIVMVGHMHFIIGRPSRS